ncbi:MAG: CBS domain-containing protein [candidate division WOR-3 bacterium]|nr:CBS domain-containing protein [candidate division WOR-3 bacterium]
MLRVKDCMDKHPKVITPDASLREAIELMLAERVDGLAVVDEGGRSLGLITLGYLLRGFMPANLSHCPERMLEELEAVNIQAFFGPTSGLFLVADFFKEDVEPLSPEDSLMIAAAEMHRQELLMLPVVEENKLAGMVSRRDVMQAFFEKSSFPPSDSPSEKSSEE